MPLTKYVCPLFKHVIVTIHNYILYEILLLLHVIMVDVCGLCYMDTPKIATQMKMIIVVTIFNIK